MDQTTVLRRLSGRKRLEQAFSLSDFVRELASMGHRARPSSMKRVGREGRRKDVRYA